MVELTTVLFWIALSLGIILVILSIFLLIKRYRSDLIKKSLEKNRIEVVDALKKPAASPIFSSIFSFFKKETPAYDPNDPKQLFEKLNALLEKEEQFREHEILYKIEIEKLKNRLGPITGRPIDSAQLPPLRTEVRKQAAQAAAKNTGLGTKTGDDTGEITGNITGIGGCAMGDDVKKVIRITDDLLEKLPEDAIDKFANSPDFELYKKVVTEARKEAR